MKENLLINKVIHPYDQKEGSRYYKTFCKIELTTDGNLSISGVVGPLPSGNAHGGAGQIIGDFLEFDSRGYQHIKDVRLAPGWCWAKLRKFLNIWDRWHLNEIKAGCEHQRAFGWDKERIDENKPAESYGKFYTGQTSDSWNLKGWVYPPHGHLTEPCPICGYKYGTAWLKEVIPQDVIDWLSNLPDSEVTPAWV